MQAVELLSPARDLETGTAAINCGADAVYLGAARFGAREAAGNDLETIEKLAQYAHRYWARVYVTLNTLLFDDELDAAERLAWQLYQAGADALIIQDAGLLECNLPPLPLFASTQMHNHTPARVAFLQRAGFQRVILARELSLDQIQAIRTQTQVELECFIHGALCVSYSGQCYLSYALGGRSGNRGQCAQPCRRIYSLIDRSGKTLVRNRHLLSLRDLNLTDHLHALLDAGVTSFKIEGRLKDKAYVMNVVAHYRQALDRIFSNESIYHSSSSGVVHLDFEPDPVKTFNRGYSTYFLEDRSMSIASPDSPKSVGEPLGSINTVQRSSFSITIKPGQGDPAADLHPGDGVCFFDNQRELKGTVINRVEGSSIFPAKMDALVSGIELFRNHDHKFLTALEKSKTERKIRVSFHLHENSRGFEITAVDEDNNQACFGLVIEKITAEKPDQACLNLEKQLRKLGGSIFECTQVEIDPDFAWFIPLSSVNELRRGVIAELEVIREFNREHPQSHRSDDARLNSFPYPEKHLTFTGNVLNQKAGAFYRRHGVETIEYAAESGLDLRGRKVMTTKHCLKYQLGGCHKQPGAVELDEPLILEDDQGSRFQLRFNCSLCLMEIFWGDANG